MSCAQDFRIIIGFFAHFKTGRLQNALGDTGVLHLLKLWEWAAVHRPEGVFTGMTSEDLEFAVAWPLEHGTFVSALLEIGWLDMGADGVFRLHDWQVHNPWVAGATLRSDQGRMGKLAAVCPEAYRKYADAGMNAISKGDYEREVAAYRERKRVMTQAPGAFMAETTETEKFTTPVAPIMATHPTADRSLATRQDLTTSPAEPTTYPQPLRNSSDPTTPAPEPEIDLKKESGLLSKTTEARGGGEQPVGILVKRLVSFKEKREQKPVYTDSQGKPLSLSDIAPKVALEPGEVEDIHPLHVPQGMTVEEVRQIRQEVRADPSFAKLPDFAQAIRLRMIPFSTAELRQREAMKTAQATPSGDTPVVSTAAPHASVTHPVRQSPKVASERAILSSGNIFRKQLNQVRELYHAFPNYQPSKGENEWLIRLCQGAGDYAVWLIKSAHEWVLNRGVSVRSARGFLTGWARRVASERGWALAI